MTGQELKTLVDNLVKQPYESEWVEFKLNYHSSEEIGERLSALSNGACIQNQPYGYLVFGVEDNTHIIKGTTFKGKTHKAKGNEDFEIWLTMRLNPKIDFSIHEFDYDNDKQRHITLFIIPATKNQPVEFIKQAYIRIGSITKKLNEFPDKQAKIWKKESNIEDWSKGIIPDATLGDLDPEAIRVARINFKVRNRPIEAEIDQWDDMTFLNKAKVTIRGKITRTAIILLGRSEAEHFLSPATARIRWLLKDNTGHDRDYLVTDNPFLLAVDKIYAKIRNLKYRYLPKGTLFPQEVDTYEPFVIREAINNCIAHQDYLQGTFINVVELEDHLVFSNRGSFLPDSVEKVVLENAPEEHYRNTFLVAAMYNLNLIETRGGGIRRMFEHQRDRFFPMPDYVLSPDRVQMTVIGKVLDLDYANVLTNNPELSLEEIILLDKVQKKKTLTEKEEKHLHKKKLIEGRKPNFHIAKEVAQTTEQKPEYSKLKGFDSQYYQDLLLKALAEHGSLTRKEIDRLLHDKLPDVLSEKQKIHRINHLLVQMRTKQLIDYEGWAHSITWHLFSKPE